MYGIPHPEAKTKLFGKCQSVCQFGKASEFYLPLESDAGEDGDDSASNKEAIAGEIWS